MAYIPIVLSTVLCTTAKAQLKHQDWIQLEFMTHGYAQCSDETHYKQEQEWVIQGDIAGGRGEQRGVREGGIPAGMFLFQSITLQPLSQHACTGKCLELHWDQ